MESRRVLRGRVGRCSLQSDLGNDEPGDDASNHADDGARHSANGVGLLPQQQQGHGDDGGPDEATHGLVPGDAREGRVSTLERLIDGKTVSLNVCNYEASNPKDLKEAERSTDE